MIKQIIIVMFLVCCVTGNACAWNEEEPCFEGEESYEIVWNDDLHCWSHKNIEHPSTYQKIVGNIWFTIKSFFLTTVGLTVTYDVDKYEWDGSAYQETDSDTFSWDLSHDANHTETTVSTFDPVEEYFKGNDTRVEEWDGDKEHPDILNVTVSIDGGGESLDDSNYGYMTMSDSTVEGLGGGSANYGFSAEGRGGGGGSGSIYEGINMYDGTGNSDGVKGAFNMVFWLLIPIIFIICVLKFSMRMFT